MKSKFKENPNATLSFINPGVYVYFDARSHSHYVHEYAGLMIKNMVSTFIDKLVENFEWLFLACFVVALVICVVFIR